MLLVLVMLNALCAMRFDVDENTNIITTSIKLPASAIMPILQLIFYIGLMILQ